MLRNNGCTEGDPSSRRSASKLASELDRVISENKKLQKELDVKNRQLAEEVEDFKSEESKHRVYGKHCRLTFL